MADTSGSNGERKVFNIVGQPNIPGRLSYSIAAGKAKFGVDVVVLNMLFAKLLRNPFGRAGVRSPGYQQSKETAGHRGYRHMGGSGHKGNPSNRSS